MGYTCEHYFLEGDCPELMSSTRLIEYAQSIVTHNRNDFPKDLTTVCTILEAKNIIEGWGESVYEIDFKKQLPSVKFIKEED